MTKRLKMISELFEILIQQEPKRRESWYGSTFDLYYDMEEERLSFNLILKRSEKK